MILTSVAYSHLAKFGSTSAIATTAKTAPPAISSNQCCQVSQVERQIPRLHAQNAIRAGQRVRGVAPVALPRTRNVDLPM